MCWLAQPIWFGPAMAVAAEVAVSRGWARRGLAVARRGREADRAGLALERRDRADVALERFAPDLACFLLGIDLLRFAWSRVSRIERLGCATNRPRARAGWRASASRLPRSSRSMGDIFTDAFGVILADVRRHARGSLLDRSRADTLTLP